jgi:hypothetical protein
LNCCPFYPEGFGRHPIWPSGSQAIMPCQGRNKIREGNQVEVRFIQGAVIIAILAFLILCIAIRPFREWLFGPPAIDDSKGFPYSRGKHR